MLSDLTDKIKDTKLNRCLLVGMIVTVKMILMGLFSSDYQDIMFVPFVDNFLSGHNSYEYYYQNGNIRSFPYFPFMLLVELLGGGLIKFFAVTNVFWRNFIFKLSLLVFDLLGFWALRKMNVRFKYATVFYFCSPIIIYATYVHGQLDIIPTTFLLLSLMFLLDWKKRYNLLIYALFLGLAIGCKFHIMAAVPILFVYVAKKKDYFTSIKYHALSAFVVFIGCVPFWGDGFINTVLLNKEQTALTTVSLDYGAVSLAIPVVALMIIYLNVYELNYFNRDLLLSMLGMLFTVFLICISPMPAWYIWVVPFYAFYFGIVSEDKYKVMSVYAVFNMVYLFYFIFLHQTEYIDMRFLGNSLQWLKINNYTAKVLAFAVMVACLVIIVHKIYVFGISSNNLYRRKGKSFVIGIAGDSGAGKSKLLEKIEHLFGSEKDVLFIEGDGDHRWARNDDNWEKYTALDPQANFLYRQADNIRKLKRGNHVERSDYNHDTGQFTKQRRVDTKKYIVLCGLHSLYLPALRDELDLKIFIDTDQELRKFWKIERDTKSRGYSKEAIVAQIEKRIPDAEKYIYPQKEYADMIITYFDKTLASCYVDNHKVSLSVKFELNLNIDVEPLLKSFEEYGVHPEYRICDDFYHQEISFDNQEILKDIDFGHIAEMNIPQYEDFFTYYPSWGTDVEGVIQVMLLYMISKKMRG